MTKSIQKGIRRSVVTVFLLFLCIIMIVVLFSMMQFSRRCREQTANAVSEAAAMIIDADSAKIYITLRQTDDAYRTVQRRLSRYAESSGEAVSRISLVSFSNTAGSYIYDTGGSSFGSKLEYDEYLLSEQAELLNGRSTWSTQQGEKLVIFRPVRTADDRLTGYLICELKDTQQKSLLLYSAGLCLTLLITGILCIILILHRFKKQVFIPLRQFTDAATDFSGQTETIPADIFGDGKDNEISRLGSAIRKMLIDIENGAQNLSKAVYDANHDSMTEVYNKGAYAAMEQRFRECGSVCVIYFDVNNLKLMNDTFGHEKGDYVICQAANYIRSFLTPADYCFRMGGDEFLLVMTECSYRTIDALVTRLNADCPHILSEPSDSVQCALSYGYAYAKGEYQFDALLAEAEKQMYTKKTELKSLMHMPER